jgi:hypothetical protein
MRSVKRFIGVEPRAWLLTSTVLTLLNCNAMKSAALRGPNSVIFNDTSAVQGPCTMAVDMLFVVGGREQRPDYDSDPIRITFQTPPIDGSKAAE